GMASDLESHREFRWDNDRQSWVDHKTGECICPNCGPNAGDVLKSITSHVQVGVGVSGGREKEHADDKRREEERLQHEEKWRGGLRIQMRDPEIVHDEEIIAQHKKRKEMFEKKLHGKPAPGAEEKKHLEHDIKTEEDIIRRYEADLARRGG